MAIPNSIKYMQILNNIGLSLNSAPILRRYKNINIDNINQSGFGYMNECTYGSENKPLNNGYIVTLIYDTDYVLQLYVYVKNSKQLCMRHKYNSNWSKWNLYQGTEVDL